MGVTRDKTDITEINGKKLSPSGQKKVNRMTDEEKEFHIPLAERMTAARVASGKKQYVVADEMNVCMRHVSELENCQTKITAFDLYKFCLAVGADPDVLMGYSEASEMPRPKEAPPKTEEELLDEKIQKKLQKLSYQKKKMFLEIMDSVQRFTK